MYLTQNQGKSVVVERFIRTLKNKTSISKNVHIDKLDNIADECNKTYSATKMKPADVKSRAYIDFGKENKIKIPKFEVNDHGRISGFKKNFWERLYLQKLITKEKSNSESSG